jgi:hypothetical protein
MSEFLSMVHQASRYSHIVLGFLGLVLFWVPVIAFKGGRAHRLSGKIFACIALWVGLTGFAASVWAVSAPVSFISSLGVSFTETSLPYIVERVMFGFSFLAFLSIATLSGVILGVALAWTKTRHEALRSAWVVTPLVASVMTAAALTVFGAWNLWLGWRGEHLLSSGAVSKYWVHVMLGLIGGLGTWSDLRYVLRPAKERRAWFYKHMECMLSTGIAFYTAFLVFGAGRLYAWAGIELRGAWNLVPWLLPTVVGLPLIARWQRSFRRKFGDTGAKSEQGSPSEPKQAIGQVAVE